jgi:hypothetical protein
LPNQKLIAESPKIVTIIRITKISCKGGSSLEATLARVEVLAAFKVKERSGH